mgnify:CR=1 FL=1
MATKTKTTGNKRKTIKELQYHIDCHEKTMKHQQIVIAVLVLLSIIGFLSPYFY